MATINDTTKNWQVDISAAGTRTLDTSEKYLDRDIDIVTPAGSVTASVSSNTGGSASMAPTGFTAASSGDYYVTLSTTAGSVKAKATGSNGFVTSSTTNETASTSVSVSGNGNKVYIPTNSITGSVDSLTAPSVAVSGAASGFTASADATDYYVTVSGSGTNGSVKGKATAGASAGMVAGGATNTSSATTITPGITGSGSKVYIPAGDYSASVASHSISTTPVVTPAISGNVTDITTTTKPSGTNGTDYWTLDPSGSVTTTGKSSATGKAVVGTSGYIPADATGKTSSASTVNITPTVAAGTDRYLVKASTSKSNGTASATANAGTASIKTQPTASASVTPTGIADGISSSATSYYVTATANSNSGVVTATGGSASASVTASSATVGVGYNPTEVTVSTTASNTGTKTGNTATTTAATASDSQVVYLKAAAIGVAAGTADLSAYTENTTAVVPTGGYLTLDAGYMPKTKISLATLVPDAATITNNAAGAATMRTGTTAYDKSGNLITGTMNDVTPTFQGGAVTVDKPVITPTAATATITEDGTFFSATGYGITTTKPSGTDGTAYLTIDGKLSTTAGSAVTTAYANRAAVTYKDAKTGYLNVTAGTSASAAPATKASATSDATAVSVTATDNFEPYYIPVTSLSAGAGSSTYKDNANLTVSDTDNGIYIRFDGKGTVSSGAGAIASGSKTSNTATGKKYITGVTVPASTTFTATNNGTLNVTNSSSTNVTSGSTSAGTVTIKAYNTASDTATNDQVVVQNGLWKATTHNHSTSAQTSYGKVTTPAHSGNVELTAQTGTSVVGKATASVRSAASPSLAITDKATTAIGVGALSSGYYPLTASLTGKMTVGTTGWIGPDGLSATDSSVTVGRMAASSYTPGANSDNTLFEIKSTAGYTPATTVASITIWQGEEL